MKKITAKELSKSGSFWIVNKKMAEEIGLVETLFFADLLSKRDFYQKNEDLKDGEWFFFTAKKIKQSFGISPYKQRKIILNLIKCNFLKVKKKGRPAKNYFKICDENVFIFLEKNRKILGTK